MLLLLMLMMMMMKMMLVKLMLQPMTVVVVVVHRLLHPFAEYCQAACWSLLLPLLLASYLKP